MHKGTSRLKSLFFSNMDENSQMKLESDALFPYIDIVSPLVSG